MNRIFQFNSQRVIEIIAETDEKISLAMIYRCKGLKSRLNATPVGECLQFAAIPFNKNSKIRAHKHNRQKRFTNTTQEIWILIKGRATVEIFNTDGTSHGEYALRKGDVLHLFDGGHSFVSRGKRTLIYEIKNGPYFGPENDRTYLT